MKCEKKNQRLLPLHTLPLHHLMYPNHHRNPFIYLLHPPHLLAYLQAKSGSVAYRWALASHSQLRHNHLPPPKIPLAPLPQLLVPLLPRIYYPPKNLSLQHPYLLCLPQHLLLLLTALHFHSHHPEPTHHLFIPHHPIPRHPTLHQPIPRQSIPRLPTPHQLIQKKTWHPLSTPPTAVFHPNALHHTLRFLLFLPLVQVPSPASGVICTPQPTLSR